MLKTLIDRPHYVFRPRQALQRVRRILRAPVAREFEETTLPWGLHLRFRPRDHIGQFLYNHGLYDLCVSEALYRLVAPGDTTADIGANIGQMTSILAARAQRNGKVYAFEPHPEIFEELSENVKLWRGNPNIAEVVPLQVALSGITGSGELQISTEFEHNRGTSSLVADSENSTTKTYSVPLVRLDSVCSSEERLGVVKLDVEGHELAVLTGASGLLETGRIRDLIFEDYGAPLTPVMRLLASHGYTLFSVGRRFLGLTIKPVTEQVSDTPGGPPSYLATNDPERALARLRAPGWAVFGLSRQPT